HFNCKCSDHSAVFSQRDSLLCKQDCQGGWDKFGCKCYRYSREWGSWNKCRESCVTDGADLVVVDSKEEMDFISGYAEYFWLGATDEASEGMWRWVDGTFVVSSVLCVPCVIHVTRVPCLFELPLT
uniref:C-type lectin domain-containing protein n=1 Tax=Gadus morhua TaxID=8049 RepID=A0A8C4ZUU7_GADMO